MKKVPYYAEKLSEYEELREHVMYTVQQARSVIYHDEEFKMSYFKDALEALEDLAQMCGIDTTYDT